MKHQFLSVIGLKQWQKPSSAPRHCHMIIFRPAAKQQAACSSEVSLACPANHRPPYWLRLCCVWFCTISRFVQGQSSKTEWGGHLETGNWHNQEIQLSQKPNKTGGHVDGTRSWGEFPKTCVKWPLLTRAAERGSAPLQRTAPQKCYKGHNKEEELRFIRLNNSLNISAAWKQPNIRN